jgi:DNA replication licensing factor MCM2
LTLDATRHQVRRLIRSFIEDFKDDNNNRVYVIALEHMVKRNGMSFEINYLHLSRSTPILAIWLADEPDIMYELFNEESIAIVREKYATFHKINNEIYVRIRGLPVIDTLRDLRQSHLNILVKVEGVVVRRTAVFPQLRMVKYNCNKCGNLMGPYAQQGSQAILPQRCAECQNQGPFTINTQETLYRNYQKITLQEAPGSVPAGRVPRQKDVILLHDLIDTVTPGKQGKLNICILILTATYDMI